MSEGITVADVTDAARLMAFGMRPKLLPSRDLSYNELVKRFVTDPVFREHVEAIAEGLGLTVLAVSAQTGVVLGPVSDSVFEQKFDEYARRASLGERREIERVLHGLAHLAIAAIAFPRPDDLAADTYVGRVSVEQADSVVREACDMLAARAAAADEATDPLEEAPQLERVWRIYLRRPDTTLTKNGSPPPSTTRGIIAKALRFLADQGFLFKTSDEQGGTYRTTPRYQVQVRELAAQRAFEELVELGVVRVTDPAGSLHGMEATTGQATTDEGTADV
jgi:hypothetical protein